MAVFVDDMYLYPMGRFGRMKMSHLIADTDEELHAMAATIGVARKWHQAPPRHDSHYDIAQSMREKAIAAGAIAITLRQCSAMTLRRRATGALGKPWDAEAWAYDDRQNRVERRQAEEHP
jgi:Protein of unknown function (DUF4031)